MDSSLVCAKEHLETAQRLRRWASKLTATEARIKLSRLAELYEEISLCYLGQENSMDRLTQ